MHRQLYAATAVTLLHFIPPLVTAQNVTCPPTPSPWPEASSFTSQSTLPDPFLYLDGTTRVQSTEEWYACRQPEILAMLQQYQYGEYPDNSLETVTGTLSGTTLTVDVEADGKSGQFTASVDLPSGASADAPAPVVMAIGGMDSAAYLAEGIAVVVIDYTSVSPDSNAKTGAFWSLYDGRDIGTLTAWAWGFHRTLDALIQAVPSIDATKVGVTGCSRLGKAALAAGLFDTRITVTMPMSSGIQGLGPYRYTDLSGQGETLENSKEGAGWWSNSGLGTFVGQAEKLPFDAHTIAAAIAPRTLIPDEGQGDPFVNAQGTATVVYPAARLVYDWLGVGEQIGIGIRSGGHCDMAGFQNILPYVLKVFKGTEPSRDYNDLAPWSAMTEAYPWAADIPAAA
ncbi:hypothetical protein FQN51_003262 [Onygenales sp. PD_10]|nr:hypothetical protein FQN51_003262 [Onygenales sp. PD_10]